jgi:hypothetical protein
MELKLFIENAVPIADDQKTLARVTGITPDYMARSKAGRRGLPLAACLTQAELLEIDPVLVVYAGTLSTRRAKKKPPGAPPAVKTSKSENLATQAMRFLSRANNAHPAKSPILAEGAENVQKSFSTLEMTRDPANFCKLLFHVPIIYPRHKA